MPKNTNTCGNKMSDSSKKYDQDKIKMSLLFNTFVEELESIAATLQYGNNKYANGEGWDTGWQRVEDAYIRYVDAEHRHRTARLKGEVYDPESGLPHRAHEIINALFQFWLEVDDGEVDPLGSVENRPWQEPWPKEKTKFDFSHMSKEEEEAWKEAAKRQEVIKLISEGLRPVKRGFPANLYRTSTKSSDDGC